MLKGIIFNLLGNVTGGLFQLTANLVLLNTLGASQFGQFSLMILLAVLTFNLISIGLEASTTYLIASRQCHFSDARKYNIVLGFVISIVALPSIWSVAQFIFPNKLSDVFLETKMVLVWLILIIMAFSKLQHAIILGRSNFKVANFFTSIQHSIFLVGVLVIIREQYISIEGALIAYLISSAVGLLLNLGYVFFMRDLGGLVRVGFYQYSKIMMSYGVRVQAANIAAFLNYRADIIILNYFLDFSAVGIYRIIVDIVEKLWIFPVSIGKALFSIESGSGSDVAMTRRIRNAVHYSFYSTLIVVSASFLLANFFLPMASKEITADGVQAFQILLLGVLAGSITKVLSMSFSARGRPGINSIQTLIIVALNIVLNLIFIPVFGLVGAAISTSAAYVILAIIKIWYAKFIFGSSIGNWWGLRSAEYQEYVRSLFR